MNSNQKPEILNYGEFIKTIPPMREHTKSKTEILQDLLIYTTMVSVLIASWKFILNW